MRTLQDKYSAANYNLVDTLESSLHLSRKGVKEQSKLLQKRKFNRAAEQIVSDHGKMIAALGILLYTNSLAEGLPELSGLSLPQFFDVVAVYELLTLEQVPAKHLFEYYCKINTVKDRRGIPRLPLIKVIQNTRVWMPRCMFSSFAEVAQTRNMIRPTLLTHRKKPKPAGFYGLNDLKETATHYGIKRLVFFTDQRKNRFGVVTKRHYAIYAPDGRLVHPKMGGEMILDIFQKNGHWTKTVLPYPDYELHHNGETLSMTDLFLKDEGGAWSNMIVFRRDKIKDTS